MLHKLFRLSRKRRIFYIISSVLSPFVVFFILRIGFAVFGDPAIAWLRIFNSSGNTADQAWGIAINSTGTIGSSWTRTYDSAPAGLYQDRARELAVDPITGAVYVGGYSRRNDTGTTRYRIVKYDVFGDIVPGWENVYAVFSISSYDFARGIAVDRFGNVYVTGHSSVNLGSTYRIATIKLSPSGAFLPFDITGGNATSVIWTPTGDSRAGAIAIDAIGNVFVAGRTVQGDDAVLMKHASSGLQLLAYNAYSTGGGHIAHTLHMSIDQVSGSVYVVGWDEKGAIEDSFIAKYSSSTITGQPTPTKIYDLGAGQPDRFLSVVVDTTRQPVTFSRVFNGSTWDYKIIRYSSSTLNSDPAWTTITLPSGLSTLSDYEEGNITIDGFGRLYAIGKFLNGGNQEVRVYTYSPSGTFLSVKVFDAAPYFEANDVTVDLSGNVYATAATGDAYIQADSDIKVYRFTPYDSVYVVGDRGGGSSPTGQIIAYDSLGNFLWSRSFNTIGTGVARAAVVDSQGFLYVAGYSSLIGASDDIRVIKYDPTGTPVPGWDKTYNSPGDGDDRAYGIALDRKGDVYVTGSFCASPCSGASSKYRTIKYSSSTAAELWNTLDTATTTDESARGIAVDSSDRVYVTGTYLNGTHTDYRTVRYNSLTGALDPAFDKVNNSGGSQNDSVAGVATDRAGNVYVGGHVRSGVTYLGWQIYKYDSSGNLLWSKFKPGPGGGTVEVYSAFGVGVDSEDNFYMTGDAFQIPGSGNFAYGVVKFASSSGNEIWQKTVDSVKDSGASSDQPHALALDPYDNIYLTGNFQHASPSTNFDIMTVKLSKFTGAGPACGFPLDASSTNWTDPALSDPLKMKKVYVDELRRWINNQRQDAGTSTLAWTDPTITANSTRIRQVHFDEMQRAISDVYSMCGTSTPMFTDAPFTVSTKIRGTHLYDLRNAIQNAP